MKLAFQRNQAANAPRAQASQKITANAKRAIDESKAGLATLQIAIDAFNARFKVAPVAAVAKVDIDATHESIHHREATGRYVMRNGFFRFERTKGTR
jgi:hypothetical protein